MSSDQRVYSDEEFAVILRTAAELSGRVDNPAFRPKARERMNSFMDVIGQSLAQPPR
jgi:hypothetical protein